MKDRIVWVDNVRGFAMLMVLWGHSFTTESVRLWIYAFHIPLFFFLSGYLFKERSFKKTLEIKTKTLLVPYLIAACLSFPIGLVLDKLSGEALGDNFLQLFYLNGSVGWNAPIWFLIVLFIVELFFSLAKKSRIPLPIFTSIVLLAGYLLYQEDHFLPFGIQIALWCFPFYTLGYRFKKINFFKNHELSKKLYLTIGGAMFLVMGFITFQFNHVVAELYHNEMGNFFLFYIEAVIGIFGVVFFFFKLSSIKILQFLSKHSLFIMCTHYIIIFGLRFVNVLFFNKQLLRNDVLFSIGVTLLMLIGYFFLFKVVHYIKYSKQLAKE